jgi:ferredoxin
MIKINISKKCQSWGQCVFDAPDVFSLVDGDREIWQYIVDNNNMNKIKIASSNCPNNAISFRNIV